MSEVVFWSDANILINRLPNDVLQLSLFTEERVTHAPIASAPVYISVSITGSGFLPLTLHLRVSTEL